MIKNVIISFAKISESLNTSIDGFVRWLDKRIFSFLAKTCDVKIGNIYRSKFEKKKLCHIIEVKYPYVTYNMLYEIEGRKILAGQEKESSIVTWPINYDLEKHPEIRYNPTNII